MKKTAGYEPLAVLLAYLRAAQQAHWTTHWQSKGSNFYSDHQLFEMLYASLSSEIDTLAEKLVAKYGEGSVDLGEQMEIMADLAKGWAEQANLLDRAYSIEEDLQGALETAMGATDEAGEMSLGLDNFMAQLADNHETALYLLGQRMSGMSMEASKRVASRHMAQVP